MEPFNNNPWFSGSSCKARLVSVTPNAEQTIAYVARVSNPKNQENEKFEGLLKYCIRHNHVSVFEQAEMTVEVITPLAIATQLLRHKSFDFQQLSLRYSNQEELTEVEGLGPSLCYLPEEARLQDNVNRQNSIFANDSQLDDKMQNVMLASYHVAKMAYDKLIEMGVCKEQARFVLPVGSYTRLYVKGNIRSWMHYLKVRSEEGIVQWEHVELANTIRKIFAEQFPTIDKAFFACASNNDTDEVNKLKKEIQRLQTELSKYTDGSGGEPIEPEPKSTLQKIKHFFIQLTSELKNQKAK